MGIEPTKNSKAETPTGPEHGVVSDLSAFTTGVSREGLVGAVATESSLSPIAPLTPEQKAVVAALRENAASQEYPEWRRESDSAFIATKTESLERLQPYSDQWGVPCLDDREIDELLQAALLLNREGEHDDFIIAACAAMIRCPKSNHQSWSHSVCHTFERFEGEDPATTSLLGRAETRTAAEALLAESAKRALTYGLGCFNRTMNGVLQFALSQVNPDKLDQPFPWKPKCLNAMLGEITLKDDIAASIFCCSETPREFVERFAAALVQQKERYYGPHVPLELLEAARNERNKESIDACIFKQLADERRSSSGEEQPMYIRPDEVGAILDSGRAAVWNDVVVRGVFVDVDDTLIQSSRYDENPKLTKAAELILALAPGSGTPLTIFTGGDPAEATKKLQELGVPAEYLPVRSKTEFRGKRLEIVIDDTAPVKQGFASDRYIDPHRKLARQWIKHDPFGALKRDQLG